MSEIKKWQQRAKKAEQDARIWKAATEAEMQKRAVLVADLADARQERDEYRQSFACCEVHTPDRWEGDGTCIICEAVELETRRAAAEATLARAKALGPLMRMEADCHEDEAYNALWQWADKLDRALAGAPLGDGWDTFLAPLLLVCPHPCAILSPAPQNRTEHDDLAARRDSGPISPQRSAASTSETDPQDDDTCPRCHGSFAATGGKPLSGPMICQKCAAEDFHAGGQALTAEPHGEPGSTTKTS